MAENAKVKQIELDGTVYDIAGQALSSDSTAGTDGIAYVYTVSFDSSTGTLNLATKYLHLI